MSEENVELARRALEALDRRDLSSWLAVNDEDLEVVPTRDWPEPEPESVVLGIWASGTVRKAAVTCMESSGVA